MPGSVPAATPSVVMPLSLSKAFTLKFEYDALENIYQNGESQRSTLVGSAQRTWTQTKRLTYPNLLLLRNFYAAQNGPQSAFYLYDQTDSGYTSYDATGATTGGRFTVRFVGGYSETADLGRGEANVVMIEVD